MPLFPKIIAVVGFFSFLLGIGLLARKLHWYLSVPLWEPPMVGNVLSLVGIPTPNTGWLDVDDALWVVYTWDAILTFAVGIPGLALALVVEQMVRKRLRA